MYRSNFNPSMMSRGGNRGMEGGNCGGNMAMRNNGRGQERNNSMRKENGCCEDTRNNAARQEESCCCENDRNLIQPRDEGCCCENGRNHIQPRDEGCCCENERNNIPAREEDCCCENAAQNVSQNTSQNRDKICECNPSVHDQLAGMALVMAYIPWQDYKDIDSEADGWKNGTIFHQLDFDFMARGCN